MSDKKTLKLRDPSDAAEAPSIKKKGRGWEISEKRLDALHEQARDMRRHSTEAHKALASRFAKADLGRYKFTRHMVIGSAIVDFGCHNLGRAIAIVFEPDPCRETVALCSSPRHSLENVPKSLILKNQLTFKIS